MLPESNQQSMTSLVRRIVPGAARAVQVNVMLVHVRPVQVELATGPGRSARASSARQMGRCCWPQASHTHTLSGVPQNRLRLRLQSMLPASQLPKRPAADFGRLPT